MTVCPVGVAQGREPVIGIDAELVEDGLIAEDPARVFVVPGSSDHLVSEAFYLRDPDGLELEVYVDRARNVWPWRGEQLELATLPLNFADLFLTPNTAWKEVPPGTSRQSER